MKILVLAALFVFHPLYVLPVFVWVAFSGVK